MEGDPGSDPRVQELRAEITSTDHEIVSAVNRRLELGEKRLLAVPVQEVVAHRGLVLLQTTHELERENGGPLSAGGLRELQTKLLELTKRELG